MRPEPPQDTLPSVQEELYQALQKQRTDTGGTCSNKYSLLQRALRKHLEVREEEGAGIKEERTGSRNKKAESKGQKPEIRDQRAESRK
jgi:hypothetical protein